MSDAAITQTQTRVGFVASLFLVCLLSGCNESKATSSPFPRKPIQIVVPFSAGGGSDSFTRIVQQAIQQNDLLPQPLVVINVPGAGGTIGSRRVKNARPDGYTLLQLHEGILTSRYSGNAEYGPEAFEPVAGTGRMSHVIAVKETSPFEDLPSLLEASRQRPDSIVFAVGIGAPSHYAGLMLENAVNDAKFRFTQSGGGAKRFASLLGGHADVTTFSVAEFIDFRSSGLRALAILSDSRHPMAPEIQTAIEQGLAVVSENMHFWWAPRGTPRARIDVLADALQAALEADDVQKRLEDMATDPVVLRGDELERSLRERESLISTVSQRQVPSLPNFPVFLLAATVLSGILAISRSAVNHPVPVTVANTTMAIFVPCAIILLLLGYVGVMHIGWLDFRIGTLLFVSASGVILSRRRLSRIMLVICLAVVLSLGLHAVFTHVFVIDLP